MIRCIAVRARLRPLLLCLLSLRAFAAEVPYQVADLRVLPDCCAPATPPTYVGVVRARAFFLTGPGDSATLWSTDGTEAGTNRIFEGLRGDDATAENFVAGSDALYFVAPESPQDPRRYLWKTDGTVAGTQRRDVGTRITRPLAVVEGRLLFLTNGTFLGIDDERGEPQAYNLGGAVRPRDVAVMGNKIYLAGDDGLWVTDGRSAPEKLASLSAWSPVVAGNRIFFIGAAAPRDSYSFQEADLWVSDGTAGGTRVVVTAGSVGKFNRFGGSLTAVGDRALFVNRYGGLVVTDGTDSGTRTLAKGGVPSPYSTPDPVRFATLNGVAFFSFNANGQQRLWRSDGTEAGTRVISDVATGFAIAAGISRVYFYAYEERANSAELFSSDGTAAGTLSVQRFRPRGQRGFGTYASLITVPNGDRVYFGAGDDAHGIEPWVSDGTPESTHVVANLLSDPKGSSAPRNLMAGEDRLYFAADSETTTGIWSTDGTPERTVPLLERERPSRYADVVPTIVAQSGSSLYLRDTRWCCPQPSVQFWSLDSRHGGEPVSLPLAGEGATILGQLFFLSEKQMWVSDGTAAGTKRLGAAATPAVAFGGEAAWMLASDPAMGAEPRSLVLSDGTALGTRVVAATGVDGFAMATPVPFNGSLYSFSLPYSNVIALWKFSGGAGEATLLWQVPLRDFARTPLEVQSAAIRTALLFSLPGAVGTQLWRTDGTVAGTVPVRDVAISAATRMVSIGERVLFVAQGAPGEPWVSDGTHEGTRPLVFGRPGIELKVSGQFVVVGETAWFAANDVEHGAELWKTDGTPEGTTLIADIVPGPGSSSPQELTRAGSALYFSADSTEYGRELWALPLTDAPSLAIDDAKVIEGAGPVIVPVRLTRASDRRVTVTYETIDATAKSGRDYTAATGTLVFEAGATERSIAIEIADDRQAGNRRSFLVKLLSADVAINRATAVAFIDDDDAAADLSITLEHGVSGPVRVVLRNAGPSIATGVKRCFAGSSLDCADPVVMLPGDSISVEPRESGTYTVRAHEPDPIVANNLLPLSTNAGFTFYLYYIWHAPSRFVAPSVLFAGETGRIVVAESSDTGFTLALRSSDPEVLSVPPTVVVPPNQLITTVPFTARKSGYAWIVTSRYAREDVLLSVRVLEGSGPLPVRFQSDIAPGFLPSRWRFGSEQVARLTVQGVTPDGEKPSGSVELVVNGRTIATATLLDGSVQLSASDIRPGRNFYRAVYSGDAKFFGYQSPDDTTVEVEKATPVIRAVRVGWTNDVMVLVRGVRDIVPGGTITIAGGQKRLSPADTITSTVVSTVLSVDALLTVEYSGDNIYDSARVTIPVEQERHRAVRR